MKYYIRLLILSSLLPGIVRQAAAEVRLSGVFADHMILQREQPVQIWGWADEDEDKTVRVRFAGQAVKTSVAADGTWTVTLNPLEATREGKPLRVESGDQSIVINNVLVGEVWHASGQSNMAMTVDAMARDLKNVKADIAAADLSSLRFCRINENESTKPLVDLRKQSTWTVCNPTTVSGFSGVAFYFARQLHRELGVPIGIIDSSRGGTPIEPYIPRAAFDAHPTLRRELELGDQGDLEGIWKLPGGVRARSATWLPGRLFHSRLSPISNYAVRGAIWYQGESNCGDREDPRDYQHKMRALINGWRTAFGNKNLPVYFVQLPGSGASEGWPYLREQQRLATDLPHTGMVVTIDIDGAGIHPANKIDVGYRLARWAMAKDYGKDIAFSGPMFDRQEIQGDKIVVHFKHAESGLMAATKDDLATPSETPGAGLSHFEVANRDGTWYPATGKLDGKTLVVTSSKLRLPIAVRYAYDVSPENCNLYNRAGLPASPFCSRPELLGYDPKS
jgi:sialate O-acetylesterase